jgi:hypothetical protein
MSARAERRDFRVREASAAAVPRLRAVGDRPTSRLHAPERSARAVQP